MNKILLLALLMSCSVTAKTVYKSTDNQGRTIYSDQPAKGAQPIEVPDIQTFKAPTTPKVAQEKKSESPRAIQYQLEITSPRNNQTFTNETQSIKVSFSSKPSLQKDDYYRLFVDGKPHGQLSKSTSFSLDPLPRGSHQIYVGIFNKSENKILAQAPAITIFQQRAIVRKGP